MYSYELFENEKPQVVVTYPGRFQPWHQGHSAVLTKLQKKFGLDNVYVLTSNNTSSAKSPFNFTDKYQLMSAAGVPGGKIIETNSMYALPENFDPSKTIFVTAVGEPDKKRLNPDSVIKKDKKDADGNVIAPAGSPSYFKNFDSPEDKVTADQHGYVVVVPEVKKMITLGGETYDVSHGTSCRDLWNSIRDDKVSRSEFLKQLYGRDNAELSHIFDKITTEDVDAASQDSTSPIHGNAITLREDEELVLYLNGKTAAKYTDSGKLISDLRAIRKKYPSIKYEITREVCKEVPMTSMLQGLPEEAAGVGVVAKNKSMARDPRYSMSITKDVKPETPKNMLRAFRLSEESDHAITKEDMMAMIRKFLPLAMKELELKQLPHIVIQNSIETHDGQATFGQFVNDEEKIYLGIQNRHPVDILRTLAHELTHFKQHTRGEIHQGAGETGSPIENEAHVKAGIIMRHFNKKYPDAIHSKSLELNKD
jgi:hypothetical protein